MNGDRDEGIKPSITRFGIHNPKDTRPLCYVCLTLNSTSWDLKGGGSIPGIWYLLFILPLPLPVPFRFPFHCPDFLWYYFMVRLKGKKSVFPILLKNEFDQHSRTNTTIEHLILKSDKNKVHKTFIHSMNYYFYCIVQKSYFCQEKRPTMSLEESGAALSWFR